MILIDRQTLQSSDLATERGLSSLLTVVDIAVIPRALQQSSNDDLGHRCKARRPW